MCSIFIAAIDTRNFSFEGIGLSPEQAESALGVALHLHATQYGIPRKARWVRETLADAKLRKVEAGEGYRDGEIITDLRHKRGGQAHAV